jgi:hypothetical protein
VTVLVAGEIYGSKEFRRRRDAFRPSDGRNLGRVFELGKLAAHRIASLNTLRLNISRNARPETITPADRLGRRCLLVFCECRGNPLSRG